ncbi:MAG TPA: TonB-dependent receptor [Pyrinomonadaceae bacterium]|nr:TonB-dependent receptor [Pyrinomonadaceae bacterium]
MRTPVNFSFPRLQYVIASIALALLLAPAASAQSQITTGTIDGTVKDANGAVVPGANVEIKNNATNITRDATTNDEGRFLAPQLQPGIYTVKVAKQGFATAVDNAVEVNVGQTRVLTFDLKVSEVGETVNVTATQTVDVAKTEISTTINETAISTTPILGRKFEDLLTLTPGVSITQGPDGDEINFSGQRGIFNNVSLDGGDYNNGFFGEQLGGQRAAIDITLEAVKEFQVVATGASAEFGRTASGIINVITKSGTNEIHGSAFYFQRLEALTANTSDGKPLDDFHREQYGFTIGGPIKKDRAFYFFAFEGINENLARPNLSEPIGTPCPISAPTIIANEALINGSEDCQRLALINFFRNTRNQEEGLPIKHKINNQAFFSKGSFKLNDANQLDVSYNFDHSKNENQTFDVATYGNSANGIEGPSKINVVRANLFSTISPTKLNEAHFSYSRELRPRSAIDSNIPADTAMGFATTFRFGNPFFLQPAVDELLWRTQVKDNFSIITGNHTIKLGGEWLHTLNDQVFRGFFTGRYIFDSVTGFLRYASPAGPGGFGPSTVGCSNGTYVTAPASCPPGSTPNGGPLLLYLQGAGLTGPATDAAGFSKITNEDYAVFAQDSWKVRPNFQLNYGLRWEAQMFPDPVVAPQNTAYGIFLNDPRFPSDGTLPDQKSQWQPRVGFAWDISKEGKTVLRASTGIYYARQNMLSQVGSITTNGVQQQTIFLNTPIISSGVPGPVWPNVVTPPSTVTPCVAGGITNPFPCFSGVRVFSRDYQNPRVYTFNVGFEQEVATDWSLYLDFTHSKGVHLTRFLNVNRNNFFRPFLDETMVTSSVGKSAYDGFTVGMRKRFSRRYQLEWNYTYAKDKDDDSNERDPFTDRAFDINNLQLDYAYSDRDIRHKFNFFTFIEMGWGFDGNFRVQGRTAQPITPGTRTATNRNTARKDNEYFSFDWRIQRPIRLSERYSIIPIIEMFNTFNNANNINPLVTPGLFNFDGFLRQGVGDPRQVQLAVKFTF